MTPTIIQISKYICPNLKMYLSLLPIICKKYKVCLYKSRLVRINRGFWAGKNKTWTDRCCGNRKLLEGPSTSGSCWRRHHRSSQPTTQPRSTQDKISSFLRRSLNFISNPQYLQTLYPSLYQGLKRCRQQLLKHCLLRNWNSYETNKVLLHSCRK